MSMAFSPAIRFCQVFFRLSSCPCVSSPEVQLHQDFAGLHPPRSSHPGTKLLCSHCSSSSSFSKAIHSRSSSSFGRANFRVAGIIQRPLGLKREMEQGNILRKVEAGGGSAEDNFQNNGQPIKTRRIVEHIVLFKMKDSLTEDQEKEMLDSLWSLQYHIKNVICTTVGRLTQKTPDGYTHALFTRFPTKQALDEYMGSPLRWRVAQDLVIPFFNGLIMVDFEADVEDDIETIFRRGNDFQEGLEVVMFFKLKKDVSPDAEEKFLKIAGALPEKYSNLVQLTIGTNFVDLTKEYFTHGLLARLPSEEVHHEFEEFLRNEPTWIEAMGLVETSDMVVTNFVVVPTGKTVM